MAVNDKDKQINNRIYLVVVVMFIVAIAIVVKLLNIQWVEGEEYRKLAKNWAVQYFEVPANKGNIYSADGSLLATSVNEYDIRFDAMVSKDDLFEDNVQPLADSLSKILRKPASVIAHDLRRARANKNRFMLIARNLSYTQYSRVKTFPLLKLGANKGGLIVKQKTVRKHPVGEIAQRTIGYERINERGEKEGKGIELAFSKYLNGRDGKILKQRIAKGQFKPIRDQNEIDPRDGYDVYSTIDVYIQDIAHHALLKQLQKYNADHGCVVVMETKTGKVRAISNLGRAKDSLYYERDNYAIREAHEPGSTYKLAGLMALLEDKKADTSTVYNSNGGVITYNGKKVRDSEKGGYGKISLAKGFEKSSNTVLVQAVYNGYKSNPQQFIDHLTRFHLDKKLDLPLKGEGEPRIPRPGTENWSAIALPWMAFGYGVLITPLQTLTFYNAVANNGVMVKPQFVSEIKEWNRVIRKYEPEILNPKICSDETLKKVRAVMENVVKRGTGKKLYNPGFSMAGKTGTAQANYNRKDQEMHYISSFVGYFPADNPKYSCIVVVHDPDKSNNNYYGADVAGPVFQRIAQKIYTDAPPTNEIKSLDKPDPKTERSYGKYYAMAETKTTVIPNLRGMAGMDAVALLENMKMKVRVIGTGKVRRQSIPAGQAIAAGKTIILELS